MAAIGEDPILESPAEAIAAFERDLPMVLKARTLEQAGWRRLDDLTLLVPMIAPNQTGSDEYYLRLGFGYYDNWPPSAQFVNPKTVTYAGEGDKCWLPKVEGTGEIHVHPAYQWNNKPMQLICCSVTLEFYIVRHSVEPKHLWNRKLHNFSATINAIQWALSSEFYKGRQHALPVQ